MIAVPDPIRRPRRVSKPFSDPVSRTQVDTLDANAREQGWCISRWVTCAAVSFT